MLIEFRVKNFLSIQDEQVLSCIASSSMVKIDNTVKTNRMVPRLLKSVAIYGANAAGKSNIIKAMFVMHKIVISDIQRDGVLYITPFLLGDDDNEPSRIEITFSIDNTMYQYGFSTTKEMIFEEWLLKNTRNKNKILFERIYNKEKGDYVWRSEDKECLEEIEDKKKFTRNNALFLSVSVLLNGKKFLDIYNYIKDNLKIANAKSKYSDGELFTLTKYKNDEYKDKINKFLQVADLDIYDMTIKEKRINAQKYKDEEHNTEIENNMIELIARTNHFKQDNKTIKSFPLESESDGTQEFLKLIGPFIDAMENNYIVVIDELEAHLHPKIAQFIVDMFNSQEVKNESCAQLIFTTHNTNLINNNIFRKDQIYFCEKQNKATKLYSLFDFKTTNDNWELNYLLGRYGGIPNITNFVY